MGPTAAALQRSDATTIARYALNAGVGPIVAQLGGQRGCPCAYALSLGPLHHRPQSGHQPSSQTCIFSFLLLPVDRLWRRILILAHFMLLRDIEK